VRRTTWCPSRSRWRGCSVGCFGRVARIEPSQSIKKFVWRKLPGNNPKSKFMFVTAIIAVTYVNLSININLIILYGGVSR